MYIVIIVKEVAESCWNQGWGSTNKIHEYKKQDLLQLPSSKSLH